MLILMNRIILTRTPGEHWEPAPYTFYTDREDLILRNEIGKVIVLPCGRDVDFIYGIACKDDFGIGFHLGTASSHDLTERVYEGCVEHGKNVARSMPTPFEFVDETGGARELNILSLGARNS